MDDKEIELSYRAGSAQEMYADHQYFPSSEDLREWAYKQGISDGITKLAQVVRTRGHEFDQQKNGQIIYMDTIWFISEVRLAQGIKNIIDTANYWQREERKD